jgi:hypothetical protein
MLMLTLASVLFSCSRSGFSAGDSSSEAAVVTPVDCTYLCPAPEKLVDEATQSDAVRMRPDLPVGTAQVLLGWSDGHGERWFFPPPTNDASIHFGGDELPVWDIRIEIPCLPESTVSVQVTRDAEPEPLTPGTYPIVAVGFEAPLAEQGVDLASMGLSGDVVITRIEDGVVSGYMQGRGGGTLQSYVTQEDLGLRYEVAALRFEQIAGEFVASP